jgi:uncharacterized protein (DUF1501 family)
MKRRDFLKTSTAVSLPLLLNGFGVKAMARSALFNAFNGDSDKVLVLIQLNGGNDGLNTILPIDQYDKLANARGNILIPESSALLLDGGETALHPAMTGIKGIYDNARMAIVQGVGYPNQNRSHFRSTDIWTSGSPAEIAWNTGWLGRYLDLDHSSFPDGYPNSEYPDPFAITIGSLVSSTCQGIGANYSLAITDPFTLSQLATGGEDIVPNTPYGDELTFLRQTILQTNQYAGVISDAANAGSNMAGYPADNALAQQLKNVALLMAGGLKTKIYVVSLGGFDTHANQVQNNDPLLGDHANLLQTLSDAVAAFQQDLQLLGLEERVVTMTFSEFGRRIRSNDSLGTDHGSAAPLMVFGSCINAGILGDNPDIPAQAGVEDGVGMQYDFRNIYGSVLMDWFEVPEDTVKELLFEDFQYIPVIQPCSPTSTSDVAVQPETVDLFAYPNPFRSQATIRFTSGHERVRLSVFDAMSCERAVLFDKVLPAGQHEVPFDGHKLSPGTYYVRVQMEGGRQKTKVLVKQ